MRRALVGAVLVALFASSVLAADETTGPVRETTQTCRCTVCEQTVCCKAPTGFAPLDAKCTSQCHEETWTVVGGAACELKSACCR